MVKKSVFFMKLLTGQISRGYCATRIPLTNLEIIAKRNALFEEEQKRQAALVTRVEKIRVKYNGVPESCTMVMNKDISTPADCLKHLPERIAKMAVIAYVDGKPWDVHSPLQGDCELSFAHFKDPAADRLLMVNKVFWRTCSYLLGLAIERSFKEEHRVLLHSWPAPSVHSGSFVYDAVLPLQNWTPSERELLVIGHPVHKLYLDTANFYRLEVAPSLAKKIFEDNPFKHQQVDEFAASDDNNKVVLYRCLDHVDISRGPMMANTGFIRGFDVASVHSFDSSAGLVYRFQAIAYPAQFTMSPFSVNLLKTRARAMNTIGLPEELTSDAAEHLPEHDPEPEPEHHPEPERTATTDADEESDQRSTKAHKAAQ